MKDRKNILEFFESQKSFYEKKVSEGIEQNRKGNARIQIFDKNGSIIPFANIKITQKTHEFRFGANIFMLDELETTEKNEKYKRYFADVFNMATLPFYWDALEPEQGKPRYAKNSPKIYRRPPTDLCIEFCESYGIEPREHALAYDLFFPKWLYDADVDETKRALEKRYAEISERYGAKIPTIEVTNEMKWDHGKTKFYESPNFIEWCFKLAEKYFPQNQLVCNEWTHLCWEDQCLPTDAYYAYIKSNLLKGARIDAIGMQYHLMYPADKEYEKTRLTLNPENLYKHMDLYATFHKPLQITEITIPSYSWNKEDEEIQAEVLEKLYSVWFSHPNVEQIVYWNLVDGYAHLWESDPQKIAASQGNMSIGENYYHGGLLRFDLSPKPAYYKLKELTQKIWHTEESLSTDKNGIVEFRGFYGKYDVEISVNGQTILKEITLSKKTNNRFEIRL